MKHEPYIVMWFSVDVDYVWKVYININSDLWNGALLGDELIY